MPQPASTEVNWQQFLDNFPAGAAVLGPDYRLVYANRRLASLTGFPADDLTGRSLLEILPQGRGSEWPSLLDKLPEADGAEAAVSQPLLCSDGTWRPVRAVFRVIRDAGLPERSFALYVEEVSGGQRTLQELEALFAESLDMMAIASSTGYFLRVNPAFVRILGWSEEEILSKPFLDFVHPDDRTKTFHELKVLTEGKDTLGFVNRYGHKNGGWRWVQWTARAATVEGKIFSTGRDVTAEKEAGAALHKLTLIASRISNLVAVLDAGSRIEWVNEAFTRITGFPADAAMGERPERFLIGLQTGAQTASEASEALRLGRPFRAETINTRQDGGVFWLDLELIPAPSELDGSLTMLAIGTDITERRQNELRLQDSQRLLSAATRLGRIGAWELDLATMRPLWSPEIYAIHEVDPATEPDLTQAINFYALEARPLITNAIERSLQEGVGWDLQLPFVTAKGRRLWVRSIGEALFRDGKCVRLTGAFQDLTEERMLRQRLNQAERLESVGRLAAGIAHDFNNLLTVVTGYGQLLCSGVDPSRVPGFANEVLKAAERGANLTQQLLAFSRQQILQPVACNLNAILRGVESLLLRLIGEQITLKMELDSGNPWILADPAQVERVIMNLAVNARDAMEQGGSLWIRTREEAPGTRAGQFACLEIQDSGIGMNEEVKRRIFEPFFTTKDRGLGSGLGLSTVLGIVDQSDGVLEVDSEPAAGSTFRVYLPSADRPAANEPAVDETGPPPVDSASILVVEDDPALMELLVRVLSDSGHTVYYAANGQEAMSQLEKHAGAIRVLVSDCVMPGISGQELAKRTLHRWPATRILLISGYTSDKASLEPGALPGVAFLQKPFSPADICGVVRALLDSGAA